MRQYLIGILAATLLCLHYQSAKADDETGLSLRGSYAIEDVERSIKWQLSLMPLNLSLGSYAENMFATSARSLSDLMEYRRPHFHLLPFEAKREREIWGARILKTSVRYDFSAEDSIFDEKSALAIEWRSGAVGLVYETQTDLGFLARFKIEGQKISQKDLMPTMLPTPQSPIDVEIAMGAFVELVFRN